MPKYNTIPVTVKHQSGGYSFKTNFNLNSIIPDSLTVDLQNLVCAYEEPFSGLTVYADYNDGTRTDITADCTIIPPQSMTDNGAVSGVISTKAEDFVIPQGYHNGGGSVKISPSEQAKIVPENIRDGVTLLGVTGTIKAPALTKLTPNGTDITHYWLPRTISSPIVTITYEAKTNTRSDEYIVEAGKSYMARFVAPYGARCTCAFSTDSLIGNTANIGKCSILAPIRFYENIFFTAPMNGYLVMYKDDTSTDGFQTECYEINY